MMGHVFPGLPGRTMLRITPAICVLLLCSTALSGVAQVSISAQRRSPFRTPKIDALNPRRHVYLDGKWQFRPEGQMSWRTAQIPGSWQDQFPDLRDYIGKAEYRRTVSIPAEWQGDPWIVFGAVDWATTVVVNDRYVGFHEGGYTPFAFNLADYAKPGQEATITLSVEDSGPSGSVKSYPFAEIPHGKQDWYGNISGPWQSVWLEERARTHVRSAHITPGRDLSSVQVEVQLSQTPPQGTGEVLATIYSPRSAAPAAQMRAPLSASTTYTLEGSMLAAEPWTPDNPALYTANVSVVTEGGAVIDQYATRFGMRTLEASDGRILLNGRPIFLAGVLDQDFYPGTGYTPPSEGFLRSQFTTARKLGFNLLRCHIKIPDPMYLRLADEMGFLVWYELPNVGTLTPAARNRLTRILRNAAERDYNSPSLAIVSIANESWGIDLKNAEQRKWLVSAYMTAKDLFRGRLVIDNSPCAGNFHIRTDIEDFHAYHAIPEHAEQWSSWLEGFAGRPEWTFSPFGDASRTGKEPLLVSEMGSWGLPVIQSLLDCHEGQEPWWFHTPRGSLRPAGAPDRFASLGLEATFGDYARLARATQESQLLAFKYLVEELRKHPGITGFVWTELADTQWESNGLLDFCRNPKSSARIAPFLTGSRCVFGRLQQRNVVAGGRTGMSVWVSNYGPDVEGSRVQWEVDGYPEISGSIPIPDILPTVQSRMVGSVELAVPNVTAFRQIRVVMRWMKGGDILAQNYEDINVLAAPSQLAAFEIYVDESVGNRDAVLRWLESSGARPCASTIGADLAITGRLTPSLSSWTTSGGRTILLAGDRQSLPSEAGLRIVTRDEKGLWGDWVTSFTWLTKQPALAGILPRTWLADWTLASLTPELLVDGVGERGSWDAVECGIFGGWLHDAAGIIVRAGDDSRRLLICTLRIPEALEDDPIAGLILTNLINEISAPDFRSAVQISGMD